MRRADRLLQIIQIFRRERKPVTASNLAEELEVSIRTIYRDMVALELAGVPVVGEAGIGYVLDECFDLPPLMFTADELEAIILGARMVESRGDALLVRAARDVVAKVATVIPESHRHLLFESTLFALRSSDHETHEVDTSVIRGAIRRTTKIKIAYCDEKGDQTNRIVWPIALGYWRTSSVLASWCELRSAYRHFRTDRISEIEDTGEPFPVPRRELLREWRAEQTGVTGLQ